MEKTINYLARAEELQVRSIASNSDERKKEYLMLAAAWADLAEERQKFLHEFGQVRAN